MDSFGVVTEATTQNRTRAQDDRNSRPTADSLRWWRGGVAQTPSAEIDPRRGTVGHSYRMMSATGWLLAWSNWGPAELGPRGGSRRYEMGEQANERNREYADVEHDAQHG